MKRYRLTKKELDAALAAVVAMLAGEDNQGDWPEDVTREVLDSAAVKLAGILTRGDCRCGEYYAGTTNLIPCPKHDGQAGKAAEGP